jgi:hypothetical protein
VASDVPACDAGRGDEALALLAHESDQEHASDAEPTTDEPLDLSKKGSPDDSSRCVNPDQSAMRVA